MTYIKGVKNFFPMPNLIFSLGLSAEEIAIYMYLMFRENRTTHTCYPSLTQIGDNLKMSRPTTKKYVDMLVEKQLISIEPTTLTLKDGSRRNGTLKYTILPIYMALDYYNDKQSQQAMKQIELAKIQKRMEKLKPD